MNKKVVIGVVAILAIVVIATLYFGQSITGQFALSSSNKDEYVIGVTLPLTGELANYGTDSRQSIELAVTEINSNGGINGSKIKLVFEDDQCDKTSAVTNVEKLSNDGIKLVLGPFCSGASLAVAPLSEKKDLFFISGSPTNPAISDYNMFFRTIPSDTYQGKFAAEYAYGVMGKKTVAISSVQTDYAYGVKEAFKKRFVELGGKVLVELTHPEKETDLRNEIAKIKDSSPEFVYLAPYIIDGGSFLKQAKESGISVPILSPESVEDPKLIEIAQGSAEGLLFTKPKNNQSKEFSLAYKKAYGVEPGAYGAFYFDATNVLANAMKTCSSNTKCIAKALVDAPVYSGVSGSIDFDEHGDVIGAEYVMKTVKDGNFAEYK
ncbi:MAG: branched-chain amino acid ABC transporter substrate-binding protein [archaeon]|jgi:branched-chain amino acid transport system substrate-binding protein